MGDVQVAESGLNLWVQWYFIATYILAGIAILGFAWSIRSSRKVSETLSIISDAIGAMTIPLIKFAEYRWLMAKENEDATSLSPVGVKICLRNVSNVPLQIRKRELKCSYGRRVFNEQTHVTGEDSPTILAPGDGIFASDKQTKLYIEYLTRPQPKDFIEPAFKVSVRIEYSKLWKSDHYVYFTERLLVYDPENPQRTSHQVIDEYNRELKD